ncbi:MAG: TetR family transcriptional regulator [Actinomycetia bacterium]|nr:TetR family transcriptional regulator [Actinomycetes bacterium]
MALAAAQTTRERLVAAAIEVFRRDGYERARVQDIAREAGLTTGAIYANYRGKAELLAEAIGERTERELEALLRDGGLTSSVEILALLGDRLLTREGDRPLILEAVVASARDPELATMLRARVADRESRFAALVERGKRNGEIDDTIETAIFARFCVMVAFGAVVMRTLDVPAGEPEAWHSFIGLLLSATAPAQPPAASGDHS